MRHEQSFLQSFCRASLILALMLGSAPPQASAGVGTHTEQSSSSRGSRWGLRRIDDRGSAQPIDLDLTEISDVPAADLALRPDSRIASATLQPGNLLLNLSPEPTQGRDGKGEPSVDVLRRLSVAVGDRSQGASANTSAIRAASGIAFENASDGGQAAEPPAGRGDGTGTPPGGGDRRGPKRKKAVPAALPSEAPLLPFGEGRVDLFPGNKGAYLIELKNPEIPYNFEPAFGGYLVFAPLDMQGGTGEAVATLAKITKFKPVTIGGDGRLTDRKVNGDNIWAELGAVRVELEAVGLVRITGHRTDERGVEIAKIEPIPQPIDGDPEREKTMVAVIRSELKAILKGKNLGKAFRSMVSQAHAEISDIEEPRAFAMTLAKHYPFASLQEQEFLLTAPSVEVQLQVLMNKLTAAASEVRTMDSAKENMEKMAREHFLREQMRAIKKELGESEDDDPTEEFEKIIKEKEIPESQATMLRKDIRRLASLAEGSPERGMLTARLRKVLDLPWNKRKKINEDIARVRKFLKEDHSGIDKVVDRIVEYVAVYLHTGNAKGKTLCFVGPPGVGKTSLGQSIARALDLPFARVSVGGVNDPAEIRGHRMTYMGSDFGQMLKSISKQGVKNGVLMLDEIDKMKPGINGDPNAVMLEFLDPEQNHAFNDHYAGVEFDVSETLKIVTANSLEDIPGPLRDRLEIIRLDGYDVEQKVVIARDHLVKKKLAELKIATLFEEGAIREIIDKYTREAGVRRLEQRIEQVLRKLVRSLKEDNVAVPERIAKEDVAKHLDKPNKAKSTPENDIGIGTGLWVSDDGGNGTLPVEVVMLPGGKGEIKVKLTGRLQETMQQSAEIAFNWVRANHQKLGIPLEKFTQNDFHIHIPDGATPKDGPSAGAIFTTTIVSALLERPIKKGLAMTGEMTLRGAVTGIGGLKGKTLAAERDGMTEVLYPAENEDQVADIPAKTKQNVKMTPIDNIWQVLKIALDIEPKQTSGAALGSGATQPAAITASR